MKIFLFTLAVMLLTNLSLSAKEFSLQKSSALRKRQPSGRPLKLDKNVESKTVVDKTFFDETKPEKSLRSDVRKEKTVRADRIGKEPVLKRIKGAKPRKGTHFREWP